MVGKMLSITESAKNQLIDLCESNKKWGVKLAVKGGGCAGFTYDWSFIDDQKEIDGMDEVININEKNFIIDGMSLMYVMGTVLDYKKEIFGSSFVFENPNAKSSCGCGTSFSIDWSDNG